MKARLNTERLGEALAAVKPAVGRDKPFVRLTLRENGMEVAADDLRLGVRATIDAFAAADQFGPDVVMVPYRELVGFTSATDATDIEVANLKKDEAEGLVTFKGDAQMKLPMVDPTWFPQRPEPEGETIKLDEEEWEAVRRLIPFASLEASKPILQGISFSPDGVMVCDDLNIAAYMRHHFDGHAIVPAESLAAIREDGGVSIMVGDRAAKITHESGIAVSCSSIEGTYPDLRRHMEPGPVKITLVAAELRKAVERCAVTGLSVWGRGNKLRVEPHSKGIEVTSIPDPKAPTSVTNEVVLADTEGFDFALGVNSRSLIQLLDLIGTEEPTLHLSAPLKPIMATNDRIDAVLMPMKAA